MARLYQINAFIPSFLRKTGASGKVDWRQLPDDELCNILNLPKNPESTIKMLKANQDPYDYDLHGLPKYIKWFENVVAIHLSCP
jgi:hypothetical protein